MVVEYLYCERMPEVSVIALGSESVNTFYWDENLHDASHTADQRRCTPSPDRYLGGNSSEHAMIENLLPRKMGFDIALSCFILFKGLEVIGPLWKHISKQSLHYCSSSISIENYDDLFECVMEWLTEHSISQTWHSVVDKSRRFHKGVWQTFYEVDL